MGKSAEISENTGDPEMIKEGLDVSFKGHANVDRSRLDEGSDTAWKGKRKLAGQHGNG